MVVAVSLRKASDPSYSSIVGAGERKEVVLTMLRVDIFIMWDSGSQQTRNISRHVQRGGGAESFGRGRPYRELIGDAWVELRKEVMAGIGGQGRGESWPLEGHRRVKGAQATVTDLWRADWCECASQ